MADRDIETVGDLRLALEGIEDTQKLAIHVGKIKNGKTGVVKVKRFGDVIVLYCTEKKE